VIGACLSKRSVSVDRERRWRLSALGELEVWEIASWSAAELRRAHARLVRVGLSVGGKATSIGTVAD
jgi:hypothetical protein